jgi:hypothetical protein
MKESHQHLDITGTEWDHMASDFKGRINTKCLKRAERAIEIVGTTKNDIVKFPEK